MTSVNGGRSDFFKVNVSNSKNDSVAFELKFAKDMRVAELKCKLEIVTGGCAGTMRLELYKGNKLVALIDQDSLQLCEYPIDDGMRIHVVDIFASIDDDTVEKFELTQEQYSQKADTVRNFLKMNRLGKYNEEELRQKEEKRRKQADMTLSRAELCTVGARCQITVPGNPTRRGTIRYNGPLDNKNGIFIGVEYDEPLGKNNGTVAGKVYFDCRPNYGSFVSPLAVEVGDFPAEDCGLDDEL